MRQLCLILGIGILAGCGQEVWDVAQAPEESRENPATSPANPTPVSPTPAAHPEEIPAKPEEVQPQPPTPPVNPEENPFPVTPPNPSPVEIIEPVATNEPPVVVPPVQPVDPTTPETQSEEGALSPAEIIARKLISANPEENLEVLNEALEAWITQKGALPEKLSDMVNGELLPMLPMAPEGKAFIIDRAAKRIVLAAK